MTMTRRESDRADRILGYHLHLIVHFLAYLISLDSVVANRLQNNSN